LTKIETDVSLKNNPVLYFFIWLVIAFSLSQYLYSVAKLPFKSAFVDFGHYYYFARALEGFEDKKDIASDKEIIYTLLGESVNPPYKDEQEYWRQEFPHAWGIAVHPPIFYILMRPLSHVRYKYAAAIWLSLNQILLLGALILVIRAIKARPGLVDLAAISFMTANFIPLQMNNNLGQLNITVLFLVSLAFYAFTRRKENLAGISLGLAMLVRWFPALLIFYFLFKKKYRIFLWSAIVVSLGFLISIWRLGLPLHLLQLKYMPGFYFQYVAAALNNQSLSGFFYRLLVRTIKISLPYPHNLGGINFVPTYGVMDNLRLANALIFLFSSGFVLTSLLACRKKINNDNSWRWGLELALFVSLMPVLATCVTVPSMPWLLFVFIFLLFYLEKENFPKTESILFIVSYIMVGMEYWFDGVKFLLHGPWVVFLSGKLYGAIILWFICFRLLLADKGGMDEK
jgi:uncharacterized membrane protein